MVYAVTFFSLATILGFVAESASGLRPKASSIAAAA